MADVCAEAQVPAVWSSVAGHDLQCPGSDGCGMLFNNSQLKTGEETWSVTDRDQRVKKIAWCHV